MVSIVHVKLVTLAVEEMAHVKVNTTPIHYKQVNCECVIYTDIDECVIATHSCDRNAMCTNSEGSFDCVCFPGFTGDGLSCSELKILIHISIV